MNLYWKLNNYSTTISANLRSHPDLPLVNVEDIFWDQRVEENQITGFCLPWIYRTYSKEYKTKQKEPARQFKGNFCLCQVESQYWNNRMSLWFLQWCMWKMAVIIRNLWEIAVSCPQSTHTKETELGSEVNLPLPSFYCRNTKTTVTLWLYPRCDTA